MGRAKPAIVSGHVLGRRAECICKSHRPDPQNRMAASANRSWQADIDVEIGPFGGLAGGVKARFGFEVFRDGWGQAGIRASVYRIGEKRGHVCRQDDLAFGDLRSRGQVAGMVERDPRRRKQHHPHKAQRTGHPVHRPDLPLDEHLEGRAFGAGGLGEAHTVGARLLGRARICPARSGGGFVS